MRHFQPPRVETMRKAVNSSYWEQAYLDCPLAPDTEEIQKVQATHPDDLLPIRGVHLKACCTPEGEWTYTGKLVKYRGEDLRWSAPIGTLEINDEVVVMSTSDKETIWFGTVEQYEKMWCVD